MKVSTSFSKISEDVQIKELGRDYGRKEKRTQRFTRGRGME
jgi:hypothetical protein